MPRPTAQPGRGLASLDDFGIDAAVMFPNFGLLWEQMLAGDRGAQRANARAYNRFMADVCSDGEDRLFGVAHSSCTIPTGRSRRSGECEPRASAWP